MKAIIILFAFLAPSVFFTQKHTPHGAVFGKKPSTVAMQNASAIEAYMDKKTRISTTIRGRIIKVTQPKGGWFDIDAGNGKVIAAHFKVYDIMLPSDLNGRTAIIEGVAQKQFVADDQQHLAGNKSKQGDKIDPKKKLTFEVTGLIVE